MHMIACVLVIVCVCSAWVGGTCVLERVYVCCVWQCAGVCAYACLHVEGGSGVMSRSLELWLRLLVYELYHSLFLHMLMN